jgi:hypothetical protein
MKKFSLLVLVVFCVVGLTTLAFSDFTDPGGGDGNGTDPSNCPSDVTDPSWVSIKPEYLNPKSNGNWLMCRMEFPEAYYLADLIQVNNFTLKIDGQIVDTVSQFAMGDSNGNGLPDYFIKFSRAAVQQYLPLGETSVRIDIFADVLITCYAGGEYIVIPDLIWGRDIINVVDLW